MSRIKKDLLSRLVKDSFKDINKKFWKELVRINITGLIINVIARGISPVRGGRFQKYAESYILQIAGKIKFFTNKKTGGVFPVLPEGKVRKTKQGIEFTPLTKSGKVQREKFEQGLGVGKKRSPVSLKVSGDMHKGLYFDSNNGKLTGMAKTPDGKHNLWEIHNKGTDKIPARRLLPTEEGEQFTRVIDNKITEALTKEIGVKVRKRFLNINLRIK